ncbi:unnamed protein product, partial [Heterosigma akashiwo]
AVELDQALGDAPVQYREVQGRESPQFLALFRRTGGLSYREGAWPPGSRTWTARPTRRGC